MTEPSLDGLKVAILVAKGFEEVEMTQPREALEEAGAQTILVSPEEGKVRAWNHTDWGGEHHVDERLEAADPKAFDALLLPGGVMNPDRLRMNPDAVAFARAFFDEQKPVAVICHGPWTVIEAGAAKGRRMISWPSLKTDLRDAGAEWVDEEVVRDGNLLSSRKPEDIPAFNRAMLDLFSQARQASPREV
ncbi:MAG: type 1 glutamine amidotransferase domain-containing protein [Caulobacteraceae bacterium]